MKHPSSIILLDEFDVPNKTIQWAREAIDESCVEMGAFFEIDANRPIVEVNPNSGYKIEKVRFTIPDQVQRKITEALVNARHSFDQSLFAACCAINKRPRKDIYFPWRQSPKDLTATLTHKDSVIPPELWEVIRRQQPYPTGKGHAGGDDAIRQLATIANSKHIGLSIAAQMTRFRMPDAPGGFAAEKLNIGIPKRDPVKNQMIIEMTSRNIDLADNYQTAFGIIFDNAPALESMGAQVSVLHFTNKAQAVMEALQKRCVELRNAHDAAP